MGEREKRVVRDIESFWFYPHTARCRYCAFNECVEWPPEQPVVCLDWCTLWDDPIDLPDEWICPWYKPYPWMFRFRRLKWLYRFYLWLYRLLVKFRYWCKRWSCFPPPC